MVTPLGSRGGGRFSCYRQVTPLGSRGGGAVLVLSTGDPAGVPGRRGGSRAIDRRPLWGPDGEGWLSCYRQATPLGSGRRGMALVLSTGDTSGVRTERDGSRTIDRRHLWGPESPKGQKEESDRAWSFADPRHVAADTLARVLSVDDESIAGCLR